MEKVKVTRHAAERQHQRFGTPSRSRLRRAWEEGVRLPRRYGDLLAGKKRRSERWIKYRIHGSQLLLGRGDTVITTWRLSEADFAAVLAWTLTGVWA